MLKESSIASYVFSLSDKEFKELQEVVNTRINAEKYHATTFEELALFVKRPIKCPKCFSERYILNGHTPKGTQRFRCLDCYSTFTLLNKSIFRSAKIPFDKFIRYIALMSFNVPLEMLEELCEISTNTAMLWRQKIFNTVNDYQNKVVLKDRVWIDETYVNDSHILHEDNNIKKRGLSKQKICIVVAIDIHKNIYTNICGHGKPSSTRIYKVLKEHIDSGSVIVHDGDRSHAMLIEKLNLKSETYIANTTSQDYLEKMALINNLCSWIKRYLYRFIGMDLKNLQSYLNWFVYLFRVKDSKDKWPKTERILRHLALDFTNYTRKY